MILYLVLLQLFIAQIICQQIPYNNDVGKYALYYAKTAYCDQESIQSWECKVCNHTEKSQNVTVLFNQDTEAQNYVAYNPKENQIIISFRGTVDITNWLSNLDFPKIQYPLCQGCFVHEGFYKHWLSTKEQTIAAVQNLLNKYPKSKILVTGHSLGGAAAILCALDLQVQQFKIDQVITFGSPRVGNKEFAFYGKKMIPNLIRVVHMRDPVPHVPTNFMGFVNIPTEVWYNQRDDPFDYKVCSSEIDKESEQCSYTMNIFVQDHLDYLDMYTGCSDEKKQIIQKYVDQENQNNNVQNLQQILISRMMQNNGQIILDQ